MTFVFRSLFLFLLISSINPATELRTTTATHETENPQSTGATEKAQTLSEFLYNNRRFIFQRVMLNLAYKGAKDAVFVQTGEFDEDKSHGIFLKTLVENGIRYSLNAALEDTLKTDDENWAISAVVAGICHYFLENKGLLPALGSAVQNYSWSEAFKKHLGAYLGEQSKLLYYVAPFFTDNLAESSGQLTPSFIGGLCTNLGYVLTDPNFYRIKTPFEPDSFADNATVDVGGWALAPALAKALAVHFTNYTAAAAA